MKGIFLVLASIFGGVVLTLITGLVSNTPVMIVGAMHYGYPLAWLIRLVIAPEYFPWRVDPMRLVADIAVWSAIVAVILFALTRSRR